MRPAIGISANVVQATWGVWDRRAALLPFDYITEVQRAGGLAMIVPPDPELERDPDQALDLLDGLILSGGADIDPSSYGAERHPMTVHTAPERDRTELALARRAIERDMPVLGICRGMQLLNIALGGTLRQHLPEHFGHEEHRRTPGSFEDSEHDVRLAAGSLAALAAGEELHSTKSHHHQGIDRLGQGLEISGYATLDELPETIELPDRRFVLGVQWHPEADQRSRVISALVRSARQRDDGVDLDLGAERERVDSDRHPSGRV